MLIIRDFLQTVILLNQNRHLNCKYNNFTMG